MVAKSLLGGITKESFTVVDLLV